MTPCTRDALFALSTARPGFVPQFVRFPRLSTPSGQGGGGMHAMMMVGVASGRV